MNDEPESNPAGPKSDETPIVGKLVDEYAGDGDVPGAKSSTENSAESSIGNFAVNSNGGVAAVDTGPDDAGEVIRVGSPFAKDPELLWDGAIAASRRPQSFYDLGPLRYTAIGAASASLMVLGFASAASLWFPGGGTLIAALGCALAIFGLYSSYRKLSAACLILHLLLFIFCYSQAIAA